MENFDVKDGKHANHIVSILLDCARQEKEWQTIVEEVSKEYQVQDWMDVRFILQKLLDSNRIKRTDSVEVEKYVLV